MSSEPRASQRSLIPLPVVSVDAGEPAHDVRHRRFWRTVDEAASGSTALESTPKLGPEFPPGVEDWHDPVERRTFLRLSAASLGLAGLGSGGCLHQPEEKIVPYVRQPEEFVPGKPLYYATAMTLGGYATGLLVESHLGRPTKIEGNPEHPASRGATDAFAQASILSLYDPDRSQTIRRGDRIGTWGEFLTELSAKVTTLRESGGRGLAILTETITSPTLGRQLRALLNELPEAKWHQYEPLGRDNVRAGAKAAFGEYVDTIYHFDRAETIVALDAEFLVGMPGSVRYARDFMSRRAPVQTDANGGETAADRRATAMCRLYAVESTPTLTGATADHRLPLAAAKIEAAARQLAAALGVTELGAAPTTAGPLPAEWLRAVVDDLEAGRGNSVVIAGDGQPAIVHVVAHAINRALGNVGTTVEYVEPIEVEPTDQHASLGELCSDVMRGEVAVLLVLGGNPVYNAAKGSAFAMLYDRVPWRVHLSEYFDETSYASHWHVPMAHYLETWGDARAYDGTLSVQQPLIAPLYNGKSPLEFIAAIRGQSDLSPYHIVRQAWRERLGDEDFEARWRRVVHDGLLVDSSAAPRNVTWSYDPAAAPPSPEVRSGIELTFTPDASVWDGRFANNGWLQELPRPFTKLTWDNAALVAPQTAALLQVADGDVVRISWGEQSDVAVEAPVLIVPGQAADSIALALGYGRRRAGRVGNGVGVDVYAARPATSAGFISGVRVDKTGRAAKLALTQRHHTMEGRDLIKVRSLEEYRDAADADALIDHESRHADSLPTLYPKAEESADAWGMAIDQTACIGCNACVVACQAENNIPIVGKQQVAIGREMHWIRIDNYYRGDIDSPEAYFQPVPCMHCENAPCELVCPVAATVHSHEGLNQMVYNRCVGTRYCSNNCPYKVRRFNFLDYREQTGYEPATASVLDALRNPDVTVRSRGVMEKCTYCVQRINVAKIDAQKQNRAVRDGEIVTACQAVCPTQAITFGNVHDLGAQVAQRKRSPLNYSLLAELNAVPRTTYLAVVRNPHPGLGPLADHDAPTLDPPSAWLRQGGES